MHNPIETLFSGFTDLSVEEKIRQIEKATPAARTHPSGILLCMPKVTPEGMRAVKVEDFEGMDTMSNNFGHELKAPTDFFTNENSITVSGSHLAAQSIRYKATGEEEAMKCALAAYRSLRIIFQFGVDAGQRGFMGKPFHFEYSAHTTGDQYLHMLWGLWNFRDIATAEERAEIDGMLVAVADYQISVDYSIAHRSTGSWNMRTDPTDYNAIMAAIVAAAFKLTGEDKYREAFEFVMLTGKWKTHRRLDYIVEQFREGTYRAQPWDKIAGAKVEEGEFAHWEQIQHCQFTAISAVIIHECVPDLFTREDLTSVLELWWGDHSVGFDRDKWGYLYWFMVSSRDRSWRHAPRTERLPRDQWFGGSPLQSFTSSWIYGDCLARFIWTALMVTRYCPAKRDEAKAFAEETFQRLEPRHLLWISDPDGKQIPPEVKYFSEFLSSEAPECLIASYWEGRQQGLWA